MAVCSLARSPVHNGLSFEAIEFAKPGMTITGTGVWEKTYSRNKSNFNISLNADKIDMMLGTFGYDVTAIKGGKTSISIDAGWEGSPDEFSLDKLAGSFDIRVKKGRLPGGVSLGGEVVRFTEHPDPAQEVDAGLYRFIRQGSGV